MNKSKCINENNNNLQNHSVSMENIKWGQSNTNRYHKKIFIIMHNTPNVSNVSNNVSSHVFFPRKINDGFNNIITNKLHTFSRSMILTCW